MLPARIPVPNGDRFNRDIWLRTLDLRFPAGASHDRPLAPAVDNIYPLPFAASNKVDVAYLLSFFTLP
jgi:hypothetical protein